MQVGLPISTNCLGNEVRKGSIKVEDNVLNELTLVGLRIRSKRIGTMGSGNLQMFKNGGPAEKHVNANTVFGGVIQCKENDNLFDGMGNFGEADPPPPSGDNQCTAT